MVWQRRQSARVDGCGTTWRRSDIVGQPARPFCGGGGVNDSGLVEILGSDGKPRARIGVLNGSGAVVVLDSKGRILATLP